MTEQSHPLVATVGRWRLSAKQVSTTEWKVIADNGCGFDEWATGLDLLTAAGRVAEKLGESQAMFVAADWSHE